MKQVHLVLISIISISFFLMLSAIITAQKPGSCTPSACGKFIEGASCQCDIYSLDSKYNDYCEDIQTACPDVYAVAKTTSSQQIGPKAIGSCQGYCGSKDPIPGTKPPKYCDDLCDSHDDCGYDYKSVCKGQTSTDVAQSQEPLRMYVDVNYNGWEYFHQNYDKSIDYLPVNDQIPDLASVSGLSYNIGIFNDKISSLKLAPGYVAIVYKDFGFSVKKSSPKVFTESEPDLSKVKGPCDDSLIGNLGAKHGWDDCISSVKVCKKDDTNCIQQATQGKSSSAPASKFTCINCEFQASSGKWVCDSCNA